MGMEYRPHMLVKRDNPILNPGVGSQGGTSEQANYIEWLLKTVGGGLKTVFGGLWDKITGDGKTGSTSTQSINWTGIVQALIGTVPSVIGGIKANKAIEEAYDRYVFSGERAVNRAQDLTWGMYQQGRRDLGVYAGGGAQAFNKYLDMIDVAPLTQPLPDLKDEDFRFPLGGIPKAGELDQTPWDPTKGPSNFPTDFWGSNVYQSQADHPQGPATGGANHIADIFWGPPGNLGRGGILGNVLNGKLTVNQGRHLALSATFEWMKDLADNQVSFEDIDRTYETQTGLLDMFNELDSLDKNSSVTINDPRGIDKKITVSGLEKEEFPQELLDKEGNPILDEEGNPVVDQFGSDLRVTNGAEKLISSGIGPPLSYRQGDYLGDLITEKSITPPETGSTRYFDMPGWSPSGED